ncbi:hypothetical protein P43SY_002491 [Pythium insidiosum]|uniref:Uncharacterized protein n=1 Tax=Pythium insidiosum TaxID=114742 RepID=A0AAD5M4M1_PYTIN|nr:hypothetical protein P43SY_002491 [Pythium insidiosum]
MAASPGKRKRKYRVISRDTAEAIETCRIYFEKEARGEKREKMTRPIDRTASCFDINRSTVIDIRKRLESDAGFDDAWRPILLVKKPRDRRKKSSFARRDFESVRQLDDNASLDKLRADLYDSIERTVRIQQAFVKQLRKEAPHSNRIKHIIDLVDLIPFHADSQRNILDEKITHVLKSKAAYEKLREEEEAEATKKADERDCLACLCSHF